ncbi:MAG: hypothetical protein RLZZ123_1312 [Pseudomonadota bacterium]|jgi:hypothetical protein
MPVLAGLCDIGKLCKTRCVQVSPKIGMPCKADFEADIRRYLHEVQRSRSPEFGMKRRMGFCRASLDITKPKKLNTI